MSVTKSGRIELCRGRVLFEINNPFRQYPFYRRGGNYAGTQNDRRFSRQIQNRRLYPDATISARQNDGQPAVHVLRNLQNRRRTRTPRFVCRRSGKRHAARTYKTARFAACGHPDRNGVKPSRDVGRERVALFEHNRQAVRPKLVNDFPRVGADFAGDLLYLTFFADVHDERIVSGTPLRRKNFVNRARVECVCPKTVNGFGGKGDNSAVFYYLRRNGDVLFVIGQKLSFHFKLMDYFNKFLELCQIT